MGSAKWLMAQPEEPEGNHWIERAVNTTVVCDTPGCTGRSSLQAYDPATEEARLCKLNIHVHPTDFDDEYGKEPIDLWKVNGYSVKSQCDPMARGCNATAWRPLYSCLREMNVDHLVEPDKGSMVIEGKLDKMVDECPYNGNYLSAVAAVTCLVREIPTIYAARNNVPLKSAAPPLGPDPTIGIKPLVVNAELGCSTPGCSNVTTFYVDPTIAFYGGKCLLDVELTQTDFDSGATETLEFIALKGLGNLSADVQPGRNPCNEEWGYSATGRVSADVNYTIAKGVDVTKDVLKGAIGAVGVLQLEGKISEMVDECGYDGHLLLHAMATVTCTPPANMTAPAAPAEEAAAAGAAPTAGKELPFGTLDEPGIESPGHTLREKLLDMPYNARNAGKDR